MLNKEICKKCYKNIFDTPNFWTVNQEMLWSRKKVQCLHIPKDIYGDYVNVRIDSPPNEDCPYILEHVVSEKT